MVQAVGIDIVQANFFKSPYWLKVELKTNKKARLTGRAKRLICFEEKYCCSAAAKLGRLAAPSNSKRHELLYQANEM